MSERTILMVLRGCLAIWGLLWIGAGVANVAFPEVAHSDLAPPSAEVRVVLAILQCTFGSVLVVSPRFFARRATGFVVLLLLALALPVLTLTAGPVTVREYLSVAALWFFPVLMQTLLVLLARKQVAAG